MSGPFLCAPLAGLRLAVGRVLGKGPVATALGLAYMMVMAQHRSPIHSGPSQRQLRVGELIRRTLSDVLARGDVHDPELNRISITVGEVRTSTDLKVATAYVMPLGGRNADDALVALNRNKHELRRVVAKAMTLKFAPELRFMLDETFDRMDETRRLFSDERVRRDVDRQDVDQQSDDVRDDDAQMG
jgi:ribosome-binding factor A